MKNLFLSAVIFLSSLSLTAQTEKGRWFFGGDTSLGFTSTNIQLQNDGNDVGQKSTVSKLSFKPSANYFIKDNLAVGLGILFESETEKEGSSKDKTSSFAALPTVTYFFNSGKNLVPYLTANVGLMSLKYSDTDAEKFSGLAFGAGGGVAYFLNNSVSVNLGLSYLNSNLKNKKVSKNSIKTGALGVTVGFGIFL